ncbi:MAG: hypothetical protein K940chlam8_00861 [Chlamydiae bacterium]|nr:hypothetical protein [Chlamydiota bacterium]
MKKVLYSTLFTLVFMMHNVCAFSFDNKPAENATEDQEAQKWVYFEGNFVLGRLNANVEAVSIQTTNGNVQKVETMSLRHTYEPGFKVGFGVFLSKSVELHASWLCLQNKNLLWVSANGRTLSNPTLKTFGLTSITNGYIATHLHDRTQVIDTLIKSRRFFSYNNVSCLPVIGLRVMLMDRNAKQVGDNQDILRTVVYISDVNVRLIGLVAGVDLNYKISSYFNFFGSAYTGALTGRYKQWIFFNQLFNGTTEILNTATHKQSEDFREFFDATFGFSFNFNIGKTVNVLIRFGAYLLYFDATHFGQILTNGFNTTDQKTAYGNTFQALTAGLRLTF